MDIKEPTMAVKGITAGTFDLFHAGHVLMLKEAKTQCDHLIACILIDPSFERSFKNKPSQTLRERIIQLEACKYVDQVIVYGSEAELLEIFETERPDVRILGEEYVGKNYTGKGLPLTVYFNSRKHHYSSTELRERIKNS